jgi:hypothetical protein
MADKKKEKDSKKRELLVVRHEAVKQDTEKGKALLDAKNEGQAALIYRACSKGPTTFGDILAAIAPKLRGKAEKTIRQNAAWYLASLRGKSLVKTTSAREEVKQ